MLDVHAPHERMHGFRDFLLHLLTITIGLLIALSLEGCVEWRHHRNLAREAEDGLREEIVHNAQAIPALRGQIQDRQKQLDEDLNILSEMRAHPSAAHGKLSLQFGLHAFNDVRWKTAQTTGAIAFMPYQDAQTFSDIYGTQDEVFRSQEQVVSDVIHAASYVSTTSDDWRPTPAQIDDLTERIGAVRMRLLLLSSLIDALDKTYQKFELEPR